METSAANTARVSDVINAVRALGMLLNTAQTYQTSHAVFTRSLEERMPLFDTVLRGAKELSLVFQGGQVFYQGQPLEAGNIIFRKIAQVFQGLSVQGLALLPGLTSRELVALIEALIRKGDEVKSGGLQAVLDRAGVKKLREQKHRVGGGMGMTSGSGGGTGAKGEPAARGRPQYLDLDTGGEEVKWEPVPPPAAPEPPPSAQHPRTQHFKSFVHGMLEAVVRREAPTEQVSDLIATEFDRHLAETAREIENQHERRERCLESVKDVVLTELENLHLAAVVLDADMMVLGANATGRQLIGPADHLEAGSPLANFIASGKERQIVDIGGAMRMAHSIVAMDQVLRVGAMLVTLE